MIKKAGLIAIIIVMFFSSTVFGFSDIRETDWFYNDITELKEKGVITGYKDGTYRPKNDVTNAEALTMILRASGLEITKVSDSHWAMGAVFTGIREGVLSDQIATYYFDDKATRGLVAEYVVKALKLEESKEETKFKDTDNVYAVTLFEEGIILGVLDNGELFYYPEKPITRAEIVAIVSRVMKYKENKDLLLENIEDIEETSNIELPVKLVPPVSKSEYDIKNAKYHTKEDFVKLFINMGYKNLTSKTIKIYDKTREEIESQEFKDMVYLAFKEVYRKYPEYYSFANGVSYNGYHYSDYTELTFTLNSHKFTEEEIKSYRGQFVKEVDKKLESFILDGYLTKEMTQLEQAKFLFEWVVLNTKYDYNFTDIGYTGYGQIVNGTAVCQGYTSTYNLMLKRLGIEAYGISGLAGLEGEIKENHIWTIAYLDGQRYHIDTTWGDAYGKTTGIVDYSYFATNGEVLSKTHTWDRNMFGE